MCVKNKHIRLQTQAVDGGSLLSGHIYFNKLPKALANEIGSLIYGPTRLSQPSPCVERRWLRLFAFMICRIPR